MDLFFFSFRGYNFGDIDLDTAKQSENGKEVELITKTKMHNF